MKILLVEDDETLGPLIEYKLKKAYHTADWVTDAETAMSYISMGQYDVYVFDWMLPGISGIELCERLRRQRDYTPILMLTARDAVEDRVKGLKHGADDYLIKPFATEELIARIEALGRRKQAKWLDDTLIVGDLVLNKHTLTVTREGVPLDLTRKEFQLLAYLMEHQGQILSREQILDHVWGYAEVTPNTVDVTIKLLRKKVDAPYQEKYIHSHRGLGYSIRAEDKRHVQHV